MNSAVFYLDIFEDAFGIDPVTTVELYFSKYPVHPNRF
jgi:hypothetical protein